MVARRMTKGELKKREDMNNLALRSELLTESLNDQHQRRDTLIKSNDFAAERLKGLKKGLEEKTKGWEEDVSNVFDVMERRREEGSNECQQVR